MRMILSTDFVPNLASRYEIVQINKSIHWEKNIEREQVLLKNWFTKVSKIQTIKLFKKCITIVKIKEIYSGKL